jgi:hypothetical protein
MQGYDVAGGGDRPLQVEIDLDVAIVEEQSVERKRRFVDRLLGDEQAAALEDRPGVSATFG